MRRPCDRTLTVSALSRRRGCSRLVSIFKTVETGVGSTDDAGDARWARRAAPAGRAFGEEAAAEVGVLTACVCGASPGAPPAHAGAPPAARRGRRAAARPPTRAWPAGGASGQADRGGWGRWFGRGGARPRQAPARALRFPGGALPWCQYCARARARRLACLVGCTPRQGYPPLRAPGELGSCGALSPRISTCALTFSTSSARARGDRRQTFPSPARGRRPVPPRGCGRPLAARALFLGIFVGRQLPLLGECAV